MPPLSLLRPLSEGEYRPEMDEALALTDALADELPRMLAEHEDIKAAAGKLAEAAQDGGRDDIVALCNELGVHARSEEEVLYPATLLVDGIHSLSDLVSDALVLVAAHVGRRVGSRLIEANAWQDIPQAGNMYKKYMNKIDAVQMAGYPDSDPTEKP